jgi:hypothetical protein
VPAHVRAAVWERDRGECTFVSEDGHRCGSRQRLEFDHAVPVARGGQATVENIRLRCRTHNQLEAERVFGAGFMQQKRDASWRAAEARRCGSPQTSKGRGATDEARSTAADEEARAPAKANPKSAVTDDHTRDILAGLHQLGVRADLARRAAEIAATLRDATLEERMKVALKALAPKPRPHGASVNVSASP